MKDIENWETEYGRIPEGSVVFIRSDWYKKWADFKNFNVKPFPQVSVETMKFLHLERNILFHGHETLDPDHDLASENWLLKNNYCQAEGIKNLDKVPEVGGLVVIGFAKPEGGLGGFARYIAIAPSDWKYGVSVDEVPELLFHNINIR